MATIQKTIEGLTPNEEYFVKVFTANPKGRVNNRVDLPFASAMPLMIPSLSTMAQGTIILVNEAGSPVEYVLLKSDYEADINGAGRSLLIRKESAGKIKWDGSVSDWSSSDMKATLEAHKAKYDTDVQNAISDTRIETTLKYTDAACSVISAPVFLLSQTEVCGSEIANTHKEGEHIEGAAQYVVSSSWSRTIPTNTGTEMIMFNASRVATAVNASHQYAYQPCIAPLNAYAKPQGDGKYLLMILE